MKSVHKYSLIVTDEQTLDLPRGAEILSVANQREHIVLYALVDTDVKAIDRHTIYVHGTGHGVYGDGIAFIGTVAMSGGYLMFHVFRKIKERS